MKTLLNVLYSVLLELVLALAVSVTSVAVPGPLPDLSPASCVSGSLFGSGSPDHAGRRGFYGFPVAVCS